MGTSGSYGGTPGWNDIRRATSDWLDGQLASGEGLDTGGAEVGVAEQTDASGTPPDEGEASTAPPDRDLNLMLAKLSARLLGVAGSGMGSTAGRDGRASRSTGGGGAGAVRSTGRATSSGGLAATGAYGLRTGNAQAVAELGLSLSELEGLGHFDQARRIVDAATGSSSLVEDAELREINANFVYWCLEQEGDLDPTDLVRAWVVEFVFHAWLTEAGSVLRHGSISGGDSYQMELEVRATLEAAAASVPVSTTGLSSSDFEAAIGDLLGALNRIFGEEAA